MAIDISIIHDLYNEINTLQIKKNQYENLSAQITQTISRLNYVVGGGEKASSMFRKAYESESTEVNRKQEELENETDKVIEIKSNFTTILERINMKIREISNDILIKKEQLQALLAAQSSE